MSFSTNIYNIIVVYALKHISRTYPDHYPAPSPSLVYQSLIDCTSTVTTENYSKSCLKDNNSYLYDNFKSKYYETLSPSVNETPDNHNKCMQ